MAARETRAEGATAGLALVELLAALALVALIAGLAAGFIGQLRVVTDMQAEAAARAELAAAAQLVQRSLSGARELPLLTAGEGSAVFIGEPDAMRFNAVARRGFGALGLGEVRIVASPQPGRIALFQTIQSRRPPGEAPPAEDFLVADPLRAVRFEYLGPDGTFLPSWQADTLPVAVRVTLARDGGRGQAVSVQTLAVLR